VVWSATASRQLHALSPQEQASAVRVHEALRLSPRSGYYYRHAATPRGARATWIIYGLCVRVVYTVELESRGLIVVIEDVMPTDLPGIVEYEERTRP
jgi:hypothetical protein